MHEVELTLNMCRSQGPMPISTKSTVLRPRLASKGRTSFRSRSSGPWGGEKWPVLRNQGRKVIS